MANTGIGIAKEETLLAEWRTGAYSQRDLAERHKCSLGKVNKLCKGVSQDNAAIVNALTQAHIDLAGQSERDVNAVHGAVEERARHVRFFNSAAIKNVTVALGKIAAHTTQGEHMMLATTILKGKETVLGKEPSVAVQVNNNQESPRRSHSDMYDDLEANP